MKVLKFRQDCLKFHFEIAYCEYFNDKVGKVGRKLKIEDLKLNFADLIILILLYSNTEKLNEMINRLKVNTEEKEN